MRKRKAKRILAILDSPPSNRRTRRLTRMEEHAAASIGMAGQVGKIDWSKVDWNKVFQMILETLLKLLPLILALK